MISAAVTAASDLLAPRQMHTSALTHRASTSLDAAPARSGRADHRVPIPRMRVGLPTPRPLHPTLLLLAFLL